MLVVSFYTKNTIYEKEVEDLEVSCRSLGIEHYIEKREDLGSWVENTWQKPTFILECLERFDRPLLWVDADGIVLKKPELKLDCDIGVYFNNYEDRHARNATIYIEPTPAAKKFLCEWAAACQGPDHDQTIMNWVLQRPPVCKVGHLPLEYTHIFDRDPIPIEQSVVLHFQASRTRTLAPAIWQNMSGSELKALRLANSSRDSI